MARPVVAIVGRPNVGKSTLFNKLVGAVCPCGRQARRDRDRIYGDCEWLGHRFLLVDTGGIEPRADDVILSQMRAQADIAIATADVIVLVTDLRSGVVATDQDVANMLQKSGKPVILCVNKCDSVGARIRSSTNFIIWVWVTRLPYLPCTVTAPAICWMR